MGARRVLWEQLGFQKERLDHVEQWASCVSHNGNTKELLEIYVVDASADALPDFMVRRDEEIEWVHFTDVFGGEGKQANQLFYITDEYRALMVQKMRVRVQHAHLHQ